MFLQKTFKVNFQLKGKRKSGPTLLKLQKVLTDVKKFLREPCNKISFYYNEIKGYGCVKIWNSSSGDEVSLQPWDFRGTNPEVSFSEKTHDFITFNMNYYSAFGANLL
jgi:hypothetical protein